MDANAIAKALRCGNTIGGSCYAACKYRENGLCELTESQLRINAATLIETIAAENARLRAERDKAVEDLTEMANRANMEDLCVFCKWWTPGGCAILAPNNPNACFVWRGTEGKA